VEEALFHPKQNLKLDPADKTCACKAAPDFGKPKSDLASSIRVESDLGIALAACPNGGEIPVTGSRA
jgi:hypothetical protein